MTPEQLLQEWTSGEQNGLRPKRVQALRSDLTDATGMAFPRRLSEIDGMLSNPQLRGVVTRKLKEAVEAADTDEPTDEGDDVGGDDA